MRGIGIIVTLVIAAIVGVGAYQLGVAQGLAGAGTAVAPALYYHPFFFGGFGFLFPLLFIFLVFALIRGAFGDGDGATAADGAAATTRVRGSGWRSCTVRSPRTPVRHRLRPAVGRRAEPVGRRTQVRRLWPI